MMVGCKEFNVYLNIGRGETYEEERQSIQWQTHSVKAQTIEPDLDIFACDPDISPSERLFIRCVTVSLQSSLDESSLVFTEPADRIRII